MASRSAASIELISQFFGPAAFGVFMSGMNYLVRPHAPLSLLTEQTLSFVRLGLVSIAADNSQPTVVMPIFAINAVSRGIFAAFGASWIAGIVTDHVGPLCVLHATLPILILCSYAQPAEKALGVDWWSSLLVRTHNTTTLTDQGFVSLISARCSPSRR